MAPRSRRPKVGLTRMHAALDAMRPLGFSTDSVRKCVRDLLKVYGNDGWAFIEDSAYKVLTDTILELPEEPLPEQVPEQSLLEGDADDSHNQLVSGPEQCKEMVIGGEEACPVNCSRLQTSDEEIDASEEKEQEDNLNAVVAPELLEDGFAAQSQVGVCLGFAPACNPQAKDTAPKAKKPCYGWISDDEEDDDGDLLQLNPAN